MPSKTFSVDFESNGFRRASRKMDEVSDKAEESGSSLQSAGKVGAAAIAGITTAVTAAVAGMGKLIQETTQYARQVNNAAEQSGIARDRIQEIAFAAEQTSGANFDAVRDGLKELAIRSEEAAQGTGEAAEAFDRLGISQEFLQDASTSEVFRRVREEMQGASKSMRIFAAETILGGEAGEKMVQTLSLSSEEMAKMSEQARATGQVMSAEQVQALEKTRKAWTRIWGTVKGFGRSLAVAVLPIVQRLTPILQSGLMRLRQMTQGVDADSLGSSFSAALGYVRTFWRGTTEAANAVLRIWRSFVDDLSRLWDEWGGFIVEQARSAWENIVSLLRGAFGVVSGLWDTLIGTLTGNWSRAWEGIKTTVTSAALTVAQAIVGLVESILNTLAKLTSYMPGVGDAISGGLESARQSVEGFRESIQRANQEASGLNETWSGFAGGDFGGAGAGGLFGTEGGDPSRPDTQGQGVGGSGPGSSSEEGGLVPNLQPAFRVARRFKEEMSLMESAGNKATNAIAQGFNQITSGVGQAVTKVISGENAFKSFGQAAVRALKNILSQIVALIPKLAIISGLKSIFGIASGGITTFSGVFSEIIPSLDSGGKILSDGIAKVHKGETVVPKTAATAAQDVNVSVGGSLSVSMDELIFQLDRALKDKGQPGLING